MPWWMAAKVMYLFYISKNSPGIVPCPHTCRRFFIHHSSFLIILRIFVGKYIIMAVISMFYGLIISLFYGDNRQHHSPHIHVKYQNDEAVFSIPDGALIV
jgi:hypothetical protein